MKQPIRLVGWVNFQSQRTKPSTRRPASSRPKPPSPADPVAPASQATATPNLDTPIAALGLSVRAYNAVYRAGIRTVGQLATTLDEELLAHKQIGEKTCRELRDNLVQFAQFKPGVAEELAALTAEAAAVAKTPRDEMPERSTSGDKTPLTALGLSLRAYNALVRAGIRTIGKLVALSDDDRQRIRNVGPTAIAEIEARLAAYQEEASGDTPNASSPLPPATNDPLLQAVSVARLGLPHELNTKLGAAGLQMIGQVVNDLGQNSHPPAVLQAVIAYLTWWAEQTPAARTAEVTATGPSPLAHPELRELVTLAAAIDDWLAQLDDRPRQVVRLRFGLDGPALTLDEVGRRFGVTRERIRQIEKKALRELRQKHRAKVARPIVSFTALLRHELIVHEQGWPLDKCMAWLRSNDEIRLGSIEPLGLLNLLSAVDEQIVLWPKHGVIALAGTLPDTPPKQRSRPARSKSAASDKSPRNHGRAAQTSSNATSAPHKGYQAIRPTQNKTTTAPQRLPAWPHLWSDRWRDHGSFMQFVAYANERLTHRPTVAEWTADLLAWAHRSPNRSADYRQRVLDAAYIVGLIERMSYTTQSAKTLEPCLEAQVSPVELRNHCIRATLDRLDKAPALLRKINGRTSFKYATVHRALALDEATTVGHLQLFRLLGLIDGRGPIYTAAPLAASFLGRTVPSAPKTKAPRSAPARPAKETQRDLLLRALSTIGRPAYVGEIVARSVELSRGTRVPEQAAAILLLLQADETAVISLGEGVFSLTEWEAVRAREARLVLPICPRPWVDVATFHDRLLESVLVARARLAGEPTVAEFLADMLAWWGVDTAARLWVRQSVLSAYYLLGVVPFTFAGDSTTRLQAETSPPGAAELREYCQRALNERLVAMPTFLALLQQTSPARPKELAETFAPRHPYGLNDVAARLHLLTGLGVTERLPGGTYRPVGTGRAAAKVGKAAAAMPVRLRACPALLPDRPGEGHTFLESIVQANEVLTAGATVEQFLQQMIAWAGSDYPKSETYYQNVLDAYYVVGLIDRTRYAGHERATLRSTLPPTTDIAALRDHCIRAALDRLENGRRLLEAAGEMQPFTWREIQRALATNRHDASYHIRLFASLGMLFKEGGAWRLSLLADVYSNQNPTSYYIRTEPRVVNEADGFLVHEDGLEARAYLIDD